MDNKYKRFLRLLELSASSALMLSKYFLAIGSIFGWYLSIIGYALTTLFNIKIKLKGVVTTVAALTIISIYGLYKWSNKIIGLQVIDFIIIGTSIIFAFFIIIKEAKEKKPLWFFQAIAIISFTAAFILLGLHSQLGWYALIIGHINNTYLYTKKRAYIIGIMQIISIIIVLIKLINWLCTCLYIACTFFYYSKII